MALAVMPALQAPLLDWAQWYAACGWPVFPCRGKLPLTTHGFHDASIDLGTITHWWHQWPGANIGSPAGGSWWALDVDPRAGGDSTLFDLERQHQYPLRTLLSHTGGGGNHYLWQMPPGGVVNKAKVGQGLDVQAVGSYIILPPSIHPDTGRTYLWDLVDGPEDTEPQPAPDWLLALVTTPAAASPPATPVDPDTPILQGERDTVLARQGIAMAHAGMGEQAIRAALAVTNQRCQPPLSEADLDRIAQSTSRYQRPVLLVQPSSPTAPGWPVNGTTWTQHAVNLQLQSWRTELLVKKNGDPTYNTYNIGLILANHPYWQDKLWWDSVRARPMYDNAPLTKETITVISQWFGQHMRIAITNMRPLEDCLMVACQQHERDLLQIFLNTLPPWDGIPRLETWLIDTAGCEDTEYTRAVSKIWPVSMVARAMQPGCRYRYVIILEGVETAGKSALVRAIASPEWYAELSMALESKESHMAIQGVWCAEMAELDSMTRTEETRLKAFITLTEDRWVPKYSNHPVTNPRRAIFIGTTNSTAYLKGESGNTRFLPIYLYTIDVPQAEAMREQLFAEALDVYRHNPEEFWQFSETVMDSAKEKRIERHIENVYEDELKEWLRLNKYDANTDAYATVTFAEIAISFLLLEAKERWKDMMLQKQIATAMHHLGWERKFIWDQGKSRRVWEKNPLM